jgi:SAM-dependent methyltransferase
MMRVSDLGAHVLIGDWEDVKDLPLNHVQARQLHRYKSIGLVDMISGPRIFFADADPMPDIPTHKYLDRFYLWLPKDLDKREQVLTSFFDFIAYDYEELIDTERNLDNIHNLFGFLQQLLNPIVGKTVIDFGCGTGLSAPFAERLDMKLVGIDPAPAMRYISAQRGLLVWSPGELASQPQDSIDAALASYVFHLLQHTHGLRLLWSRLRPSGVIVGNFHNGQNLQMMEACVKNLHGSIAYLESPHGSERHGQYVAFFKER